MMVRGTSFIGNLGAGHGDRLNTEIRKPSSDSKGTKGEGMT